ncbi:MAG: hypothetical protein ABII79_00805 [bacterium]
MRLVTVLTMSLVVFATTAKAENAISLSEVVSSGGSHITIGSPAEFRLRVQIDTSHTGGLFAYNNAFRLYSPDGAYWDTTYGQYLPGWLPFGDRSISHSGTDGIGADTVSFYGEDSAGGFWIVYDHVAWSITIEIPDDHSVLGKTICLDSVADTMVHWPWSTWAWTTLTERYAPTWDGPHCFTIGGCCDLRGDVDNNGTLDIGDITYKVAWLFQGGPPPPCIDEADDNGDGTVDVGDLVYEIGFYFQGGPPPVPCP